MKNKKLSNDDKQTKVEKEIKYLEIIVALIMSVISFVGGIFAIIAIIRYMINDYGNIDYAVIGLLISILSISFIFYLLFVTLYRERVYDIELSIRMFLIIILLFGCITSIGLGIDSFISTLI